MSPTAADKKIPCIPLPKAQTITIPLPYGAELKSLVDMSKGPPTDCSVVHSLLLQLNPMLASMACLFKMLKVFEAVKKVVDNIGVPPNPIGVIEDVVTEVAPALADLAGCFLLFDPCKVAQMLSAILGILISYLNCLVQMVESILNFQVGIDLDSAEGNPVLLGSLQCAQANAETSMASLSQVLDAIGPLLTMVEPLFGVVGIDPIELPDLTELSSGSIADRFAAGEDPLAPVKTTIEIMTEVKNTLDAIC